MQIPPSPDFESPQFLRQHIRSILGFYDSRVVAPEGGFYQCFLDNGDCYDPATRQLVGSARYVFNYATAYRLYGNPNYRQWACHGLNFLNTTHRQANGHYAWLMENGQITDTRVMAYGHAFVVLAAASCLRSDIAGAADTLNRTWDFLERYFWDEKAHAYADERDSTLAILDPYRGQNANMHLCEAALTAWSATASPHYLDRAELLAQRFTVDLAQQCTESFQPKTLPDVDKQAKHGSCADMDSSAENNHTAGLIWEHYNANWDVDKHFNIDKPNDRYKPWGYQPGHQLEWAKLLLILHDARPDEKWLSRACELFDQGISSGWDSQYGGIVYSIAPDGRYCATEKYFWVHAEAFAAAWRLYKFTGEERYRQDYQRIWEWAWRHMIDHEYGAWFRVRNRDGSAIDNLKSPPGKTDYHTLGACWHVLENI